MALSSLAFRAGNAPADETKQGVTIYDGKPSMFHQWEFKTMLKYMAISTETEKPAKIVNQVIEALRGDALQVAMDIGIADLMKEDGLKVLVENMRKMVFPTKKLEAKELYANGHLKTGISLTNPCFHIVNVADVGGHCSRRWIPILLFLKRFEVTCYLKHLVLLIKSN